MRHVLLLFCFLATPVWADDSACILFESMIHNGLEFMSSQGEGPFSTDNETSQNIIQDARRFPATKLVDCLVKENTQIRRSLLISLQGFFEKIGTNDAAAVWADAVGLRSLLNRVGLTALPSAEREALEQRLNANNERWDALEARLANVMSARKELEATTRRVTIRLWAYEAVFVATILGHLVYQGVLPKAYCTPKGLLALCGVVATQSIGVMRYAWPRWRDQLLRFFAPRQFKKVVEELTLVADLNPQAGLPYLLELATIHDQPTRPSLARYGSISEQAAREAIIRARNEQSSAALVALSIRYLESGYLDAGINLLDIVLERNGNGETKELAVQVKNAIQDKANFEKRLGALKRTRIFWRVLGTVGVVATGSLAISHYRLDPTWVAALQSTLLSVASAIGMGKVVAYLWLRYPEGELREKLTPEVDQLHATFTTLVKMAPDLALPFLKGIASPDGVTHPFIQEAALLAILDSDHPMVGDILEEIAQANVRIRGNLTKTEKILREAIERHRVCNRRIAAMGRRPEVVVP